MIAIAFLLLLALVKADSIDVLLYINKVDDEGRPLEYMKYSFNKCYTTVLNTASVMYLKKDKTITKMTYALSPSCNSTMSVNTNIEFNKEGEKTGYKTYTIAPYHVAFVNIADDTKCSHKDDMERIYYSFGCHDKKYEYGVDKCPDNAETECFVKYEYAENSECEGSIVKTNKIYECDQCVLTHWVQCGAKETMILVLFALLFILI